MPLLQSSPASLPTCLARVGRHGRKSQANANWHDAPLNAADFTKSPRFARRNLEPPRATTCARRAFDSVHWAWCWGTACTTAPSHGTLSGRPDEGQSGSDSETHPLYLRFDSTPFRSSPTHKNEGLQAVRQAHAPFRCAPLRKTDETREEGRESSRLSLRFRANTKTALHLREARPHSLRRQSQSHL